MPILVAMSSQFFSHISFNAIVFPAPSETGWYPYPNPVPHTLCPGQMRRRILSPNPYVAGAATAKTFRCDLFGGAWITKQG
ncbi:hypothetical protein E4U50_006162 [Claviceps purpurea]|nr:hypothetical protein E4U12_002396 [Claviceps purpurea]KAG6161711.1 hypothetical protein E4U51_006925 [Claviceps purpurea]KAG6202603.1 hypothetical protein E4U50_006162 [Claviceps purpurea]